MSFNCSGCGLCCMSAGKAVDRARDLVAAGEKDPYVKDVADFPFEYDVFGRCEKLTDDHQCSVYDSRPDVCSVERMWEKYHKGKIEKQNYFLSAEMLCNSMMKEAGVHESFYL